MCASDQKIEKRKKKAEERAKLKELSKKLSIEIIEDLDAASFNKILGMSDNEHNNNLQLS